jgi:hypothetical protein
MKRVGFGFIVISFFLALSERGAADVIVPGTADPFLAGMPNGTTDVSDYAPAESPVLVTGVPIVAGAKLLFSATGSASADPSSVPFSGPDGLTGQGFTNETSYNGIATVIAPWESLVGVFLDANQPNLSTTPSSLDFGPGGNVAGGINYLTLTPDLKQVFFIGDGLTDTAIQQQVTIPIGATRLYLGFLDSSGWNNNAGQFDVSVAETPEPATLSLLASGLTAASACFFVRRRRGRAAESLSEC